MQQGKKNSFTGAWATIWPIFFHPGEDVEGVAGNHWFSSNRLKILNCWIN